MHLNGSDTPFTYGRTAVGFHSGGGVAGLDAHLEQEKE